MVIDHATALEMHERAILLAVESSERSAARYADASNDVSRDAMYAISLDAVVVHRCLPSPVLSGWGGPSAALIRTLLDLLISACAVVFSENPKLAGFKYFYSGFRQLSRDDGFERSFRRAIRNQARERILALPESERPAAVAVLKARDRAYWFGEEFTSPTAVLERLATPDLVDAYRTFSAVAHGGFLGMRLFRDNPDLRTINPQLPVQAKSLSLLVTSGRLLVEVISLRNRHELLDLDDALQQYRLDMHQLAAPKGAV
jgi:hypothetical protein